MLKVNRSLGKYDVPLSFAIPPLKAAWRGNFFIDGTTWAALPTVCARVCVCVSARVYASLKARKASAESDTSTPLACNKRQNVLNVNYLATLHHSNYIVLPSNPRQLTKLDLIILSTRHKRLKVTANEVCINMKQ